MSLEIELQKPVNTFQYIKDKADSFGYRKAELPKGLYSVSDMKHDIRKANDDDYGIYYCPNVMGTSNVRQIQYLSEIRYQYIDIDGLPSYDERVDKMAELMSFRLPPSSVVFSGNGIHAYWYVKDASQEHYHAVQKALANEFNACPTACSVAGLLRVPTICDIEIYHRKGVDKLVELMYDSNDTFKQKELLTPSMRDYVIRNDKQPTKTTESQLNSSTSMAIIYKMLHKLQPVGHRHQLLSLYCFAGLASPLESDEILDNMLILSGLWRGKADYSESKRILDNAIYKGLTASTHCVRGYLKAHNLY